MRSKSQIPWCQDSINEVWLNAFECLKAAGLDRTFYANLGYQVNSRSSSGYRVSTRSKSKSLYQISPLCATYAHSSARPIIKFVMHQSSPAILNYRGHLQYSLYKQLSSRSTPNSNTHPTPYQPDSPPASVPPHSSQTHN